MPHLKILIKTGSLLLSSVQIRIPEYYFPLEINPDNDKAAPRPAHNPVRKPTIKLQGLASSVNLNRRPNIIPDAPSMARIDPEASWVFGFILPPGTENYSSIIVTVFDILSVSHKPQHIRSRTRLIDKNIV
jgi:hypothetical protein